MFINKNSKNHCSLTFFLLSVLLVSVLILTYKCFRDNEFLEESDKIQNVSDVVDSLKQLIDNSFVSYISQQYQNKSLAFKGDPFRFEFVLLQSLLRSTPIRVGVVGGSITAGHEIQHSTSYINVFFEWFSNSLTKIGIKSTLTNVAIGGTPSQYFALCVNEYLDLTKIDILVVEFAVNDGTAFDIALPGFSKNYPAMYLEELVRAIWRKNPFIHILFVNQAYYAKIFNIHGQPNCDSIDDSFNNVAEHYGIPAVRWKHLFCSGNETSLSREDGETLSGLFTSTDAFHPSSLAHLMMANFVADYFQFEYQRIYKRLSNLHPRASVKKIRRIVARDGKKIAKMAKLMFERPPFYNATGIVGSKCFTAYQGAAETNEGLIDAIVGASPKIEYVDTGYNSPFYQQRIFVGLNASRTFANFKLASPRFLARSRYCRGKPVTPTVFLGYPLDVVKQPGLLDVNISFSYTNSQDNLDGNIELRSYDGHSINFAQSLFYEKTFCKKTSPQQLKTVYLKLKKATDTYLLNLHSVMVVFRCCP